MVIFKSVIRLISAQTWRPSGHSMVRMAVSLPTEVCIFRLAGKCQYLPALALSTTTLSHCNTQSVLMVSVWKHVAARPSWWVQKSRCCRAVIFLNDNTLHFSLKPQRFSESHPVVQVKHIQVKVQPSLVILLLYDRLSVLVLVLIIQAIIYKMSL